MPLCVVPLILTWSSIDGGSRQWCVDIGDLPGMEHRGPRRVDVGDLPGMELQEGIAAPHAAAPRAACQGLLGVGTPETTAARPWQHQRVVARDLSLGRAPAGGGGGGAGGPRALAKGPGKAQCHGSGGPPDSRHHPLFVLICIEY